MDLQMLILLDKFPQLLVGESGGIRIWQETEGLLLDRFCTNTQSCYVT